MRLKSPFRLSSPGGFLALLLLTAPLAATGAGDAALPVTGVSVTGRMADGFDFPVGKPDAAGYHKARGFTPNGHLGEDWDGDRGGNTDLGDPVYCTGNGVVVLAGNMHMGWGNVVMVRHSYREPTEGNAIRTVDSLYGHLDTILVREGQPIGRGQPLGTIGTAYGLYEAHLHFEIRKNINIGMFRSSFARDLTNYFDPTAFIGEHRVLRAGAGALIAMNTFTPTPATGLRPADGAYELGINRSPEKIAEMESSHLSKSAFSIKRRPPPLDATGVPFKVDPNSDLRELRQGNGNR